MADKTAHTEPIAAEEPQMPSVSDERNPAFVFVRTENFPLYMYHQILGYMRKPENNPPCPGRFFIGIIQEKKLGIIFGPFIMKEKIFEDSTDLGFVRLGKYLGQNGEEIYQIERTICPIRIKFRPDPPELNIQRGIEWKKAAEILEIDPREWKFGITYPSRKWTDLWKIFLSEEQIERLAQELIKLNS